MAKNEIPEQKQDVFDPSKFKFIGASEGDEIFKDQGPEYFSKTERIVSYVLHGLFALAAIALIVLGIYFGTESDYRFESWGIGAIVGIVLVGVVLLAAVVVSLLHHDFLSRGKANDVLKRLNVALYYVGFASLYTAFGLLVFRPAVIGQYVLASGAFPYSVYAGYILIAVCWVLAIAGIVFENVYKDRYVKEVVEDIFLALALYIPFFFYPIMTKTYALSSMNDARPWLIMAPILLDLGVVFKVLGRSKKGFHSAFHFCAFGSIVMEVGMLIACGMAEIQTLVG